VFGHGRILARKARGSDGFFVPETIVVSDLNHALRFESGGASSKHRVEETRERGIEFSAAEVVEEPYPGALRTDDAGFAQDPEVVSQGAPGDRHVERAALDI